MIALHRGLDARWVLTCPRCHARSRLGLIRPARPRCVCGWRAALAAPFDWRVRYRDGIAAWADIVRVPIWTLA